MENIKDEVLYGVSINGKKPRMWDEEYPDILNLKSRPNYTHI